MLGLGLICNCYWNDIYVKYKITTCLFAKRLCSFRLMAITDERWKVVKSDKKDRLLAYLHITNGI